MPKYSSQENEVRKAMVAKLRFYRDDYLDCGEVNCTKLAEDVADELGLIEDNDDASIPDYVFDMAVVVADGK